MEFQTIHAINSDIGKEALAQTVVQYLFDLGEAEAHHNIQVENFNFHDDNENETISFDSYEDIVDFISENPNGYFYNDLNGKQINIHPDFDGKMPLNLAIELLMNFGVTLVNNLSERN